MSNQFEVVSPFEPSGDQPEAIRQLCDGLRRGERNQVLLGVTGSGKTFTMAKIIEEMKKPTLIMAPNKILAAQLYAEMKEFFRTTMLSISYPTTTIISRKHIFRRLIPILKKILRLTSRLTGCGTERRVTFWKRKT